MIGKRVPFWVFLAIFTLPSYAHILSTHETQTAYGLTIVHRIVVMENPGTGEMEVFRQTLRKNPDGSLSYIPSRMSAELKQMYEVLCERMTDFDFTVVYNGWFSPAAIDGFACHSSTMEHRVEAEAEK